MSSAMLTDDFKAQPYWWDDLPPLEKTAPVAELNQADVVIVGAGYTGLCAAIQTQRAGMASVVFDSADPGWGCSTRNGGQIAPGIKYNYPELVKRYGEELGRGVMQEGFDALQWIGEFIEQENIQCDYRQVGRLHCAHSPRQLPKIAARLAATPSEYQADAVVLSKAQLADEIASDYYHGGLFSPRNASLHPGRYHRQLLVLAEAAGVTVIGHQEVLEINKLTGEDSTKHRVITADYSLTTDQVIIATSGYTGAVTPWLQRRIMPIGSYIIATEKLPTATAQSLLPKDRMVTDSRKLVVYYRMSPDGQRVLFGGRVSLNETDPKRCVKALHEKMVGIFPQIQEAKVSHSWMGFVGYTFDNLPHIGQHDGISYALGYCGSGVALASYCGTRLGQMTAAKAGINSPLSDIDFPTQLLYRGKPWFLAPVIRLYQLQDRFS